MGEPTIEDESSGESQVSVGAARGLGLVPLGRPNQAARLGDRLRSRQDERHGAGTELEHRRLGLDRHGTSGVRPPSDHPARCPSAPGAQSVHEGDQGELGVHRVAARSREHDERGVVGAHVGPRPEGQQGRVRAVPPAVAPDDG